MTASFAGRWSFKERRFVSFFLIYASTFIQGVEIAVVLPTAWKYLQTLGVYDEMFLGFLISTYSVTAVIAGLLVGHWVDRSDNTRKVLLNVNVCQIVGNCMYFVGLHPGMLIAARFLCGFGSGIGSACFSDLSRASKVSERTKILTVAFAMRQVGILVGPMYTLALHHIDIHVGPLRINEESAPGLVMAGYWIIFQFLIYFLYSNIGQEYHRQGIRVKKTSGSYGSMRSDGLTDGDADDFDDSTTIDHMLRSNNHTRHQTKFSVQDNNNESDCTTNEGTWMTWSQQLRMKQNQQAQQAASTGEAPSANASFMCEETSGLLPPPGEGSETSHGRSPTLLESFSAARHTYLDVFLDDRLIPLLFLQTIAYFILTLVQTIIPPAVEHYFGYGTKVTSVIFMVAGAEGLFVYLAMLFLQRVQDRVLVVVGYFMLLISLGVTGYVSYLLSSGSGIDANSKEAAELFWPLVGGFGIIFISVPMLSAAAVALMSKVVDRSAQGMAQGLRRTSLFLGVVFGPLWGGAMIYKPLYLYGLSAVLLVIAGVLFALSFRKLFVCHETADLNDAGSSPSSDLRTEPDDRSSRVSSV